ncbi:MAG: expansin EXLX1 family cellulose-binding protein [Oscillospiraceae bacterium]|nr:expansin EXLX1 family cellulose-binding protein [Oscillospiraceae bacterium]
MKRRINKIMAMMLTCCISAASCVIYADTVSGTSDKPIINGDVNSDGAVNVLDLSLLKSYLLKVTDTNDIAHDSSDINFDGQINIADFLWLKKYILGVCKLPEPEQTETSGQPPSTDFDPSSVLEPKGTVHTGEGTFYGGGYEGGCAMLDPVSRDYWIVAMNLEDYNNAMLAGAYLEVTGELGTINMLVTDLLPEGKKGDLDLYVDAFPLIAPAEKGRVPVSWKIVPLDTADDAPVSYKYKEGTSEFWCSVQVRNHRYPVSKLEYLNKDGEFVELERRHYNYFESREMGSGPFTFRITDIYGQVITDTDIPLVPDGITQGHSQFPV